ncbi:MAG: hypothetical protein ACE5I1_18230, partial [bacterium]
MQISLLILLKFTAWFFHQCEIFRILVGSKHSHRGFHIAAFFAVVICCFSQNAFSQTDVHLRAETGAFTRLPVEIWPCETRDATTREHAEKIISVLESDLYLSSLIAPKVVQDTTLLQDDDNMDKVLIPAQRAIRVAIRTSLKIDGDTAVLQANLLDLRTRRILGRESITGCERKLRLLVHALADEIIKILTGEDGIAKSRIVFTAVSFKGKELFVVDYDGTNLVQLTRQGSLNLNPAWTHGGRGIIYTSYINNNPDLHAYEFASGKSAPIVRGDGLYVSPAWSPDGKSILFVSTRHGNAEIYAMNVISRHVSRLTHHPAIDSSPSWSPTGRQIVFTSDRLGNPQIFIMGAEGTDVQRLVVAGEYNDSPVWSPRGDKIAYVSRGSSGFDIFVYDITSETSVQLTQDQDSNEDPTWAPDGYRIAFTSTRNGSRDIYSMMWDGTVLERLTVKGTCASPSWSTNVRPES